MSENLNKILLKPRFNIDFDETKDTILDKFTEKLDQENCTYCKKMGDNHIYIDIPENEAHLWSPQLSLEVESHEKGSRLKGFFAPKPGIWTFFMFLHFVVAVGFLIFSALAYANYVTKSNYSLWFGMMLLSILLWFTLYIVGQLGKIKAKYQMEELKVFLKDCLIELDIKKAHDFKS